MVRDPAGSESLFGLHSLFLPPRLFTSVFPRVVVNHELVFLLHHRRREFAISRLLRATQNFTIRIAQLTFG
jgi:hypothetical protein